MRSAFLILNFALLSSCQSAQSGTPAKPVAAADYFAQQGFKQLTFEGENDSPQFSETGNEIIFISRRREAHANPQVYEFDLLKNRERRVTFHDGEDATPSYINGREILYASTTDEIKESPFLNKNPDKDFPPSELYKSDTYGNGIERLTHYPGFDGEALYVKTRKPFIVFTSRRGQLTGIYKLDLKSKGVSFVVVEKDHANRSPALSPDFKRIAWISTDTKTGEQSLRARNLNGGKVEVLKENEGEYRDLSWAAVDGRLYYSLRRPPAKNFQLESYDPQKKCTQVLFKGNESLIQPRVSNERKPKIAFVRVLEDKKQIYMTALPENLGPCLESPPAAKLEK